MDLNYLYQRHQVALYMSDNAACDRARGVHRSFTRTYAALIACARQQARAVAA